MLNRREALGLAVTGLAQMAPGSVACSRETRRALRIACTDWAGAEALLSLGMVPAGVIDRAGYEHTVSEPALPPSVIDLGAGWAPNIELLQRLAPDLILMPQWPASFGPIDRIAPLVVLDAKRDGLDHIETAKLVLAELAARVGAPRPAAAIIASFQAQIDAARRRLAAWEQRPVHHVTLNPDGRHATVAGAGSLIDDVLRRLGIENAWRGKAGSWGLAVIGIEELAPYGDAQLIYVEEGAKTRAAFRRLAESRIWLSLPFVKTGRMSPISPAYHYGGLATAGRLAGLVATALDGARRDADAARDR